jgi:alkanesulfonate monooxygenase SsuD/methylene tetrahydromethanopterin reductase-like flavin-dependent oxidoreductase (luciferase family)
VAAYADRLEVPVDFGLFTLMDFYPGLQNEAQYYADTIDLAVHAESLGYDAIWVGEEHFYTFGVCPSPQILLTALAQRTQTLRVGTAISLLPFENPLRKAEDFAMVDILSGGRLDFGVGRGSIPKHFAGFNISAQDSRARYEESLAVIKAAWTQETISHDGRFWQIPELSVSPKPVQRPHPPVYRGTVSLESYELAARVGDNAFVVPWTTGPHAVVGERVRRYKELAVENGHPDSRTTTILFLFADTDQKAAVREAKEITARYSEHITNAVLTRDRTLNTDPGSALFSVTDYILSMPDNVEERAVVGTPENCIRRLEELDEELGGLDRVAFYFHPGARDPKKVRRTLDLFANEVMPQFRGSPVTMA